MKVFFSTLASVSGTLIVSLPLAISASAADFSGKQVTVQVPSGSGGTYHVYCQIVTRHLGKHLPGKPTVVIQNLPGAGGAKSASYMANAAPKDGSMLAMIAPGNISGALVRELKFDAREFIWLGSLAARGNGIALWHTVPVDSLDDLKKTEVNIGSTGRTSAGSIFPLLTNKLLGTKMKLVIGYKGGGAVNLAIERGEVQGRWNYYSGFTGVRPEWIEKKLIKFVLLFGPPNPATSGVPHMADLLEPRTPERKMYDVLAMDLNIGQGFYLPPGVPKDVAGAVRKAFDDMLADPATRKEVEARRVEWSPLDAGQIGKELKRGFGAATPDIVEELQDLMAQGKS